MPGSLPNSTILSSIDQVIAAINDLDLTVNQGDTTVNFDTQAIVDLLTDIRVELDTSSQENINARTQNFDDLISTISALVLSCQTVVESHSHFNTFNCGGYSPGGNATTPPQEPASEGETPPPGMTVPTGAAVVDRRCKLANACHENVREYVKSLNLHSVDNIANNAIDDGIALLMGYLGTIVGQLAVQIPILGASLGAIIGKAIGMAIELIQGDYSLDRIDGILADPLNQEDFICAIYSANGASGSIFNYLDVAIDRGMTIADTELLAVIFTYDMANYMWFAREDYIEDAISNASYTFDCSACPQPAYLLYTAQAEPFNVVEIGDGVDQPGDAERGWYVDIAHNYTFTPDTDVTEMRISFTYLTTAPAGFSVGSLGLPGWSYDIISDGSSEIKTYDLVTIVVWDINVQVTLNAHGNGGNGFELRKIIIESTGGV